MDKLLVHSCYCTYERINVFPSVCVSLSSAITPFIHEFNLLSHLVFRWGEGVEGVCEAGVEVGLPQTKQVLAVIYVLLLWPLRMTPTSMHGRTMVRERVLCFESK